MGAIEIDLVDEDDRGRGALRLLEHLAQPTLALAVGRAHDLGPVDGEELGVALVGHRLREARLAGARRAVQQHALRRIDPETGEQLGIAQRQLDHLAQLLDGVGHSADVVVVDDPAAVARLLELGAQLDLGVLVDVDDTLRRHGGDDLQADLRQRVGGLVEHPPHFGRHVLHRLLAMRRDEIALGQRPPEEHPLERFGRALQAHLALGRGEHHAGGRARLGAADLHVLARGGTGVGALQAVEAHDRERFVLVITGQRDRGGHPLAFDLDRIALGDAERLERRSRHARDAAPAFLLPRRCYLQPDGAVFNFRQGRVRHRLSLSRPFVIAQS